MRKLIFCIILLTSLSVSIAFSYEVTVYTYQNKIVYNNVKRIEPLFMGGGRISGNGASGEWTGVEAYRIIFKEEYFKTKQSPPYDYDNKYESVYELRIVESITISATCQFITDAPITPNPTASKEDPKGYYRHFYFNY